MVRRGVYFGQGREQAWSSEIYFGVEKKTNIRSGDLVREVGEWKMRGFHSSAVRLGGEKRKSHNPVPIAGPRVAVGAKRGMSRPVISIIRP